MKRMLLAAVAAVTSIVLFAGPALAQYPPTIPPGGGGDPGDPGNGGGGGGPAFTGASISLGLIVVGVLLVMGVAALVVSRRRSSTDVIAE